MKVHFFLAWLVCAGLLAGCGKIDELRERQRKREEKTAAKKAVTEKSNRIWEESSRQKAQLEDQAGGNGKLTIGDKSVSLAEMVVCVGAFKNPQNPDEGQNFSEIKSLKEGAPSLCLRELPLVGGLQEETLTEQSIQWTSEMSGKSELTLEDGSRWRLQEGFLRFQPSERKKMVLMKVDGKVLKEGGGADELMEINAEVLLKMVLPKP
ncbi:MAG: hypothetical protein PHV34_22870 [Verrucomicrobiae bacterium]|nr:hypothetical protein [Verrucomicrobiae bacterium]